MLATATVGLPHLKLGGAGSGPGYGIGDVILFYLVFSHVNAMLARDRALSLR